MLTIKQIDALKPKEKAYRVLDIDRLFISVPPSGKKVWQFRYIFDGKSRTLTLGKYPLVSLADARDKAQDARRVIAGGQDPALLVKRQRSGTTFADIYREWEKRKSGQWSDHYKKDTARMFNVDILPLIGHMEATDIEPLQVLTVISNLESREAHAAAAKARRRIDEVYKFAIATGRAKYSPAASLTGVMKGYTKKHYPFLAETQIGPFNAALMAYDGSPIVKAATLILQYTALRTGELRHLQWPDVDFDDRLINIPAERMKMRKAHTVPMSSQVVAIFESLKPLTGHLPYIFAGHIRQQQPIRENAILVLIRNIGYEGIATGHGFRHQFSTILNENGWPYDAIERQLAHATKSIRGIYNHAQYLDKRREMMQWYADWIDSK
ncbi:integrase [Pantoea agglomerans]|uniref:tyrosine-type recombinase/integrase n=1 Tax=Enterobacter agglomerans TaxID=549 RepID=UPI00083D97AB|nr:tyrosine-type recombinase/integrase [Pantoea agglomerans]AOE41224.1 integrase [Pantoea agglomerans]